MKTFYFWYCVTIIVMATSANYWIIAPGSTRSWGSSSGGYSSTGSGWHK